MDTATIDAPTSTTFGRSGSYAAEDIVLLLQPSSLTTTNVAQKEAAIQAGRHYGEMISEEPVPDATYQGVYDEAFARSRTRIAHEIWGMALAIKARTPQGTTLASLARAGIPYGVLLQRALRRMGHPVVHYGVSIMRGKGLDKAAMATVLAQHAPDTIVFVDGWTGKGAITQELHRSWTDLGLAGTPTLAVLADPAGVADIAGSEEDWLIPTGLLNGSVCGLVSRTVLPPSNAPGYHRAMHLAHLESCDRSRPFVDGVSTTWSQEGTGTTSICLRTDDQTVQTAARKAACTQAVQAAMQRFGCADANRVKPGIAEATRAVLRRMPERVVVRALDDQDLQGLLHLCRTKNVPIVVDAALTGPYRAITLIGKA